MKTLVALAFLVLMTGAAIAQTPYTYEPCNYQIGLFFSSDAAERVFTQERTNWDYSQFVTFYMHLVIMSAPQQVSAYELSVTGLPAGFIDSWNMVPGSGWINIGTSFNHIAAFGFPQPNASGYVYLGNWQLIPTAGGVAAEIRLLPSTPSSVGGDGPGMVINGELWRSNYTPAAFTGCDEAYAPGEYPPYVATLFGEGVTAVESRTLTGVKELFR